MVNIKALRKLSENEDRYLVKVSHIKHAKYYFTDIVLVNQL